MKTIYKSSFGEVAAFATVILFAFIANLLINKIFTIIPASHQSLKLIHKMN